MAPTIGAVRYNQASLRSPVCTENLNAGVVLMKSAQRGT